ncbi:hypothetical protein B0H11DRAFT_2184077 [Mycena galericulata]|nr:hypothetical protein B0H11DRAFT_2184077 [Mycena galericulata]
MSTIILDLPPELTLWIIELSMSEYNVRRYYNPVNDYPHLRAMALVCKAWTTPSQILLWRGVSLISERQAERWINACTYRQRRPSGIVQLWRYVTLRGKRQFEAAQRSRLDYPAIEHYTTLRLWMYGRVYIDSAGAFELAFFHPIPAACLALPCLKDLTTLVLESSTVSVDGPVDFPFRLRVFKTRHSKIHSTVVQELFRSSAGTLECLDLAQQYVKDSPTLPGLYESLSSVAAGIRALRMTDPFALPVRHLAGCTALSRLDLALEITPEVATAVLNVLPAPLEDLYMEAGRSSGGLTMLSHVIRALNCPSLSHLERLHIPENLFSDPNLDAPWESCFYARNDHSTRCSTGGPSPQVSSEMAPMKDIPDSRNSWARIGDEGKLSAVDPKA